MLGKGKDARWPITGGILLLVIVQVTQFAIGYRLTADDAMFLQYVWQGWDHVWAEAARMAEFSGRIGHYLMTPLNVLGALWAGDPVSRWLMVLGHFGVMALFACYFSALVARGSWRVCALLMLTFLALHPLAYEHMPPNAYPLQNTVPFVTVLFARLQLWRRPNLSLGAQFGLCLVSGLAMLVSEFVFLLTTALLAAEHLANTAFPQPASPQQRLLGIPVRTRALVRDLVLVITVFAIYLGYRFHHPSQYEGNTPSGLAHPYRFWLTSVYHVFAGTAFFRLPDIELASVARFSWAIATIVGIVSATCSAWLLRRLPLRSARAALAMMIIACCLMLYIAFPLASTARQQLWCLELGTCGYLDSRVSYLGIGAIAYALAILLLRTADGHPRLRRGIIALMALFIGVAAAMNHAANSRIAESMAQRVQPWQQANQLACQPRSNTALTTQEMAAIDPNNHVAMHTTMNPRVFWLQYINDRRASGGCEVDQDRLPALTDPSYISFGEGSPVPDGTLANGWSHRENWGVWSDGQASVLRLKAGQARPRTLRIRFQLYWGPSIDEQHLQVDINGQPFAQWPMTPNAQNCCVRDIPLSEEQINSESGHLDIRLNYSKTRNPAYPGEGADPRHLALGLHSLEWIEEEP
ncbi:hypothetical protein [Marinobacter sp. CA1]|uniref:hypothetical protein n=1 Tax=Marinobacter sp. CA1 TaxID=2817656 RepID=UPI001D089D3A|nr:hypothetical protein [Marinobacter sp. CA1]UDL03824.1 hypothetical protein J2887_13990 [Marinobacter sp. CA1]